ncbi:MAG: hypothetical protein K5756_04065 [Clostridiales bacterium]|nr:hypothetical protein [Clostridiales bacterium]
MKYVKITALSLILAAVFSVCVFGVSTENIYDEQMDASGIFEFYDKLSSESKDLLDELGIDDLNFNDIFNLSPRKIMDSVMRIIKEKSASPLKSFTGMLGVIFLTSMAKSFTDDRSGIKNAAGMFGALITVTLIVSPLTSIMNLSISTVRLNSGISLAFIPVLAGVIAVSGNPMLAVSCHSLTFAAAQGTAQLINRFVMPMTGVVTALGISGSFMPELNIKKLTDTVKKTLIWVISSASALFAGLLSVKGILANSADTLTSKGIKLAVNTFVPIVGSAVSEAYSSVIGSASLVRSTVGAFGIVAIIAAQLPALAELILWKFAVKLSSFTSEMLDESAISSLLASVDCSLSIMMASLIMSALFVIISAGITLFIRTGA